MKLKQLLLTIFLVQGLGIYTGIYANNDIDLMGFDPTQTNKAPKPQQLIPSQAIIKNNAEALFHDNTNPTAGNPNGKITLVELFDFRCLHSVNMNSAVNNLIKANPDLRIVFKEFPIFGTMSNYAAKAALAAQNQGKYLEFHAALMNAGKGLTEAKVLNIATSLGLDLKQFKTDINSKAIAQQIKNNQHLAQNLGLKATPVFFVGKTISPATSPIYFLLGEVRADQLQKSINAL